MKAKLYVILGSHACRTGILLMEHKGVDHELVVLPTGLHPLRLRLAGFPANPAPFRRIDERRHRLLGLLDRLGTVPSLKTDGEKVKTNREIARYLDRVKPDPSLYPADPDLRGEVEEAERWADEVFQMVARRLVFSAAVRGGEAIVDDGQDGRLGPLLWRRRWMRRIGARFAGRSAFAAGARAEQSLMAELPPMLNRIDGWIEAGVLNGESLNIADLLIAPSLALLTYSRAARPEVERHRAIELADRLLPEPAAAT